MCLLRPLRKPLHRAVWKAAFVDESVLRAPCRALMKTARLRHHHFGGLLKRMTPPLLGLRESTLGVYVPLAPVAGPVRALKRTVPTGV